MKRNAPFNSQVMQALGMTSFLLAPPGPSPFLPSPADEVVSFSSFQEGSPVIWGFLLSDLIGFGELPQNLNTVPALVSATFNITDLVHVSHNPLLLFSGILC